MKVVFFLSLAIFAGAAAATRWSPVSPAPAPAPYPVPIQRGVKGAYWPSHLSFPISAINTSFFTHVYYGFVLPDPSTNQLVITPFDEKNLRAFTAAVRSGESSAKAVLSIGGGDNVSVVMSKIAADAVARATFINSAVAVARWFNLDGVDLDWEFPDTQADMDNLGKLLTEWRAAIDNDAKVTGRRRLLLTAAVYYAASFHAWGERRAYPGDAIRDAVDWVNVMSFAYTGPWNPNATGAPAALYDPNSDVSTSSGVQSWLRLGVPPERIVMGVPLFGATWRLEDPANHGIGAPAVGVGPGGGILLFKDVVDFNVLNGATVVYDERTVSTYSYAGTSWIGYDDGTSVAAKIGYAKDNDLGGYFFWALGFDKDWIISKRAYDAWEDK